jgi:Uma2 family endonuclease
MGTLGSAAQARSGAKPAAKGLRLRPVRGPAQPPRIPVCRILTFQKIEKFMPGHAKLRDMNIALRKTWTQEEFFDWAQAQEIRYEFDGVRPVAMTGGFINSGVIGGNLITTLNNRLEGARCAPFGPDVGIQTANKGVCYPDAFVSCMDYDGEDGKTVPGPVVVFEVVGKTRDAIRRDHVDKVAEYAAVPSICRYIIVESTYVGITIRERSQGDEPWRKFELKSIEDIISLPEIGIEIPVAELYKKTKFSIQPRASA